MYVKDRPSGFRDFLPKVFAIFWVVLGGFSGAYLFSVMQEPQILQITQTAPAPAAPEKDTASEEALQRNMAADEAQQQEIAELKATIDQLQQRLSGVDTRLSPIEKLLGPVAAMPQHESAVTTAPPSPQPKPMEEATEPEPVDEPAETEEAAAPPVPPTPEPAPDPEPAPAEETAEAPAPAPEETAEASEPEVPSGEVPSGEVPSGEVTPAEEPLPPAGVDADETPRETASLGESPAALAAPDLPPGTNRFGIEIGTVESRDKLRPLWRNMLTNHAALVAGLEARRVMAPDNQWRLVAGPFSDATEAARACAAFKKSDLPCEPTVFAGDSL
ncbi:SPOR domain-containing protein [Methyloligella solikamskensis]|uniref:SPOR domain-containing protein n=1 Tax=Methyloligella solikamskensis TaxID=1177756 RepID=A0ABW3JC83_9HYPH